jgi:hypothetical protein
VLGLEHLRGPLLAVRQREIDQGQVGRIAGEEIDSSSGIRSLAHNLDVVLGIELRASSTQPGT